LLKILDFGTAKLLSSAATSSRIIKGTPQYMAPEQLAGDRPTPATDIWALGLLTFEMLTGRSYWLAVALDARYEALFNELHVLPIVAASQRARELGENVELGSGFDAWFARCVHRDPTQRYPSASLAAQDLALALSGAIRHETISLNNITPVSAPLAVTPKHAPSASGASAVSPVPLPRRSVSPLLLLGIGLAALAAAAIGWFVADSRGTQISSAIAPAAPRPSASVVSSAERDASSTPASPPPVPTASSAGLPSQPQVASVRASKATSSPPRTQNTPATKAPPEPRPKSRPEPKPSVYQVR
jgi:serine/threonine protein kinase